LALKLDQSALKHCWVRKSMLCRACAVGKMLLLGTTDDKDWPNRSKKHVKN
jgi:hypothetical protein